MDDSRRTTDAGQTDGGQAAAASWGVAPDVLELLHRESDAEADLYISSDLIPSCLTPSCLTPSEQAILSAQDDNPDVQAARSALRRAVSLLSGPNPPHPLPRSLAADVARDIALCVALQPLPMPRSVAGAVVSEVAASQLLRQAPVPAPRPGAVSAGLLARMAAEHPEQPDEAGVAREPGEPSAPSVHLAFAPATSQLLNHSPHATQPPQTTRPPLSRAPGRPSPLVVGGLLLGVGALATVGLELTGMGFTGVGFMGGGSPGIPDSGIPSPAATEATTLQALAQQVSPLAGAGLLLLLLTSALVTWNPTPALRRAGAGAFALAAGLTLPALYQAAAVNQRVGGEMVTLLGGLPRSGSIQPSPVWPQICVALTTVLLAFLLLAGAAPRLARRQRYAPIQTLSLGILLLAGVLLPALLLGLAGVLAAPVLRLVLLVAALLVTVGLSISLYGLGRGLAARLRLPVPEVVGAFLGLTLFAASLSATPLAFVLALVGGPWGAGTLLLSRWGKRGPEDGGRQMAEG